MKEKIAMRTLALLCSVALIGVGCSHETPKAQPQQTETVKTSKNNVLQGEVISFNKKSAELSDRGRAQLKDLTNRARGRGELGEATIAAWADQDLPYTGSLSKEERDLADQRAQRISEFLKYDCGVSSSDTFNMAENSNWLARVFRTDDARLKSAYSKRSEPLNDSELEIIRHNGGPSTAVVIVRAK